MMTFTIDTTSKLLNLCPSGILKYSELRSDLHGLFGREDLKEVTRVLADLRSTRDFDMGFVEIFEICAMLNHLLSHEGKTIAIAILAADDHLFGGARMFQQVWESLNGGDVTLFRDPSEAHVWAMAGPVNASDSCTDSTGAPPI